jgi:hypothetical protein
MPAENHRGEKRNNDGNDDLLLTINCSGFGVVRQVVLERRLAAGCAVRSDLRRGTGSQMPVASMLARTLRGPRATSRACLSGWIRSRSASTIAIFSEKERRAASRRPANLRAMTSDVSE